jgi:AcrR family transcriptional regulator
MGRRSDHSRSELTVLAVDAAERLIALKGTEGMTVRQIAAEIGYSPGTLYNLFKNLDELLLHVAGRTLEKMLLEVESAPVSNDAAEDLRALATFYFRFTRRNARTWRLIMEHRLADGERHPVWYRALVVQVLGRVERALRPWFHGRSAEAQRRAALTLFSCMQGICAVTQPGSLTAVPERMALELAGQLIDAFLAKWGPPTSLGLATAAE